MTFLDDPPQCLHSFRNTMLTEIGNIMIAPYHSLLLRSVNDFWGGLCDLNPAELINRQIRRLRKGCQENIMILNLITFVVSPQLSHWQTADTFLVDSFHALWFPVFSGMEIKIYERSFFSHPFHSHLLLCAALSDFLWLPLNGELSRRLGTG